MNELEKMSSINSLNESFDTVKLFLEFIMLRTHNCEFYQCNFLKIYPIFKLIFPFNFFDLWINLYQPVENRIKMINFLFLGLRKNYIKRNKSELKKIIDLIEKCGESLITINQLKYEMNKNRRINSSIMKNISIIDYNPLKTFLEINNKKFVLEMTRNYSELLTKMNVQELLYFSLSNNCFDRNCSTLLFFIKEFDKWTYYVPTYILMNCNSNKERILSIKKFVKIAKLFKKYRNFHAMFAILKGLNHKSLDWIIKANYFRNLNNLNEFVSPLDKYLNYRNYLYKINAYDYDAIKQGFCMGKGPSIIPYIDLFIQDIKLLIGNGLIINSRINNSVYDALLLIVNNYESINKHYDISENQQMATIINRMKYIIDDIVLQKQSIILTN